MTTSTVDRLVADYLGRLEAASAALPPDRRDELLDEIGGHIATARAAAADEAAVRTLLDRLGPPEVIVAAALDDGLPTDPPPSWVSAPPSTGLELAAVLMLTVGSFLPVVGWLAGVVLLWVSSRWTTAEKLLGTLVVPLGPGGVLILGGLLPLRTQSCSVSVAPIGPAGEPFLPSVETCSVVLTTPWLTVPLLVLALVAPVAVAGVLYRRARARAALEPPREVWRSTWGGIEVAVILLLGLGAFVVPVVSVVVALALMWTSDAWRRRQKVIATVLCVVPVVLLVLLPLGGLMIARPLL